MRSHSFIHSLATALFAAVEGKDRGAIDVIAGRALMMLSRRRLAMTAKFLLPALEVVRLKRGQRTLATVVSKLRLTKTERAHLQKYIGQRTGREVSLEERLDPQLLGGIRIRFGDTLVDMTLDGALLQARAHLQTNE